VISSGATYSLNQGIGRRTRARGFREVENGCIGADGEPVDCVGGGVSQMGTTFLNAAWFTGIEIVEFRQHTRYFTRYPVCHEATLSWGSLDVRVHNDSPYDIIIDTFYDDEFIGVRFISRDWADVSSWAEPQSPPSSGSFTSRCGRTIAYPDGTSTTESYTWTYDDTGF
jgi:vancomycin resistance protein YoaR